MSSSTTSAPSRSRSLRKPAGVNSTTNNNNSIYSTGATSGGAVDGTSTPSVNARDSGGPRALSPTRLPVKGTSSSSLARSASIRTVSSATNSSAAGTAPAPSSSSTAPTAKRTRPLSGILGRSRQESVSKERNNSTTTTSGDVLNSRPPRTASNRAAPIGGGTIGQGQAARPPSSSGSGPLTRSNTMARPTSSSGVPSSSTNSRLARAPSGHARTKSSITTLTGATTLRPPSQTSADSGSSSTTATAATSAADRSRPPITRSSAVTHRRNISNPSAAATSSSRPLYTTNSKQAATTSYRQQQKSPTEPPATATDNPSSPAVLHNPHRPAFTTLQQHYSPAKSLAPKPLTSTFLAPPSPSKLPSNVALSAEISRLQTELLQLHLLHRDAHTVAGQWRSSARSKLGDRFAETVKLEGQVSKMEEGVVEMRNLRALVDWGYQGGGGGGGRGSAEGLEGRIQMLDEVVCGVWAMGEPGGKYTRVVRRFEKWVAKVKEVSEARRLFDRIRAGEGDGEQVTAELLGNEGLADLLLLVTATGEGGGKTAVLLDSEWKDECAMLVRRLNEWRKILKGLMTIPGELDGSDCTETRHNGATVPAPATGESSLAIILKACRSLVDDMLAELNLMEQTERDAVVAENAWVRAVNRDEDEYGESLAFRSGIGGGNNTRAGAIWRAF